MTPDSDPVQTYALGHSDRELDRLTAQARMLDPFTRKVFTEAGIEAGMRVLDIGSGAGDVALLLASIVGPTGEVVGIDRATPAVETARARVRAQNLVNVRFVEGDPTETIFPEAFDAVVGRLVLMYFPDPAAAVRSLTRHLRAGGIIAFQELDLSGCRSLPASPLFDQCIRWMIEVLRLTGSEPQMGLKLYPTFVNAGLPPPNMRLEAAIGGEHETSIFSLVPEIIRSLLPLLERFGIATAGEVDIDTLPARMRGEVAAVGGVVVSPSFIGAWSRLP